MKAKLTLKLDNEVLERAKAYAKRQGCSLSQLVETYLATLPREVRPSEIHLTGVVAELAGVLAGAKIDEAKDDYAEYLSKKYS
jgi:antitoxin component of RelBE/YafQ-DinJ toxin-antitoxin module